MVKLNDICLIWNNQTMWPYGQSAADRKPDHCHLISGVYQKELFRFGDDPNLYICSSHVEIFKIILGNLRCSLDFEVSHENFPGFKKNNHWNGILSLIELKKIDFYPFTFSIYGGREEIIYLDFVIPQPGLMSIISYPKVTVSKSLLKLFESFTLQIWLSIALSFIIVGITVNVICCVKYYYNRCQWFSNSFQIVSNYLYLFAILTGQGGVPLQRMYHMVQLRAMLRTVLRTPLIVWMLATFLFRQLYSSNITAVMLSHSPYIIDSFEQLDDGDISILIELNSIIHNKFVEKFPRLQPRVVPITIKELAKIETVAKMMQSNTVVVQSFKSFQHLRNVFPKIKLHISEEGFIKTPYFYGIRKTSNVTIQRRLNKLFRWLHYTGIKAVIDKFELFTKLSNLYLAHPELGVDQLLTIINTPVMERNFTTWHNLDRQMTTDDLGNLQSNIEFKNGQVDIGIVLRLYLLGVAISFFCLLGEIVFILRPYLLRLLLCAVAPIQTNLIKINRLK